MSRVQAIVVREGRVLMVRHRHQGHDYWCLPGGALEPGEAPQDGALRELREECNVDGVVVRQTAFALDPCAGDTYSFLVEIGDQQPSLGHDPELAEGKRGAILLDVQCFHLWEIAERDRAFLWAAGLLSVDDFPSQVEAWGDDPSYPRAVRKAHPGDPNRTQVLDSTPSP